MAGTLIIGGGISGLSAAYYLNKGGKGCTIIEPRPRLGGVIQTEHVQGCVIEGGPDSFLSIKPAALDLIRDLGLSDDVIGSNDHLRKTFVRRNGRLIALPDGLMMMVPTRILPLVTTPLIGWGTKIRMGLELFRSPKMRAEDESVSQFIEEHYGREAVDYLAEPLLSGVYGGNPQALSVRSVLPRFAEMAEQYGSLTRGVLAERAKARGRPSQPLFRTLKGGLGQMVDAASRAVARSAEIRQGRAEAVERTSSGFRVKLAGDWLEAEQIVVACEAHNAAPLLSGVDGQLAELLAIVPYSSSMTVALGYNAADLAHPPEGFGFLVPKKERKKLVACTWIGTKFSHRVPADRIVARCFLGGMEGASVLDESDESILASVATELREIAGVAAPPLFSRIFRWPRSMAQYTVGHRARQSEVEARVAAIPGLLLAGNAYYGIGIPDCIRLGKAAAEKIVR